MTVDWSVDIILIYSSTIFEAGINKLTRHVPPNANSIYLVITWEKMADEGKSSKPFKQRKTFASRRDEVAGIRAKFPSKIPVIVERYHKEKNLPMLDKTKFLVPQELTMSQFVTIIRNRMSLAPTQSFYLIVNNKSLASMSTTLQEVYKDEKDEDGFLYMTYASQEMFGWTRKDSSLQWLVVFMLNYYIGVHEQWKIGR